MFGERPRERLRAAGWENEDNASLIARCGGTCRLCRNDNFRAETGAHRARPPMDHRVGLRHGLRGNQKLRPVFVQLDRDAVTHIGPIG